MAPLCLPLPLLLGTAICGLGGAAGLVQVQVCAGSRVAGGRKVAWKKQAGGQGGRLLGFGQMGEEVQPCRPDI